MRIVLIVMLCCFAAASEAAMLAYQEKDTVLDVYRSLNVQGHIICDDCAPSRLTKPLRVPLAFKFTEKRAEGAQKIASPVEAQKIEKPEDNSRKDMDSKKDTVDAGTIKGEPDAYRVVFGFDSYKLVSGALYILDGALGVLKDKDLSIEGYTDSVGSKAYNDSLALKRAGSVRDYLISKGVIQERIKNVSGIGKCCYRSSNDALNRRVELKLIKERDKRDEKEREN